MKYYLQKYSYTTPEKLMKTTENLGHCGQILCRDLKLALLNTDNGTNCYAFSSVSFILILMILQSIVESHLSG